MAKWIQVKLILVLTATLVAGCSPQTEAPSTEEAATKPVTVSSDVLRFTLDENGRRQSLEARKRNGDALDVAIFVDGACSRSEAGTAKAVTVEGDVDVEVDPDGEGHPTDAFVLPARDGCMVMIRLAAPERDYAWLRESECSTTCPLSNEPMTRR